MNFKKGPFEFCSFLAPTWGFWFRIYGHGLAVSNMKPLFSERNGYTKVVVIFGVKFKRLKP